MPRLTKDQINEITGRLTDEGLLIAAGWKGFELGVVPLAAPTLQRQEMRLAFFAGAQHLFSSIMGILDPGDEEPTAKDLARMDQIAAELKRFEGEWATRVFPGAARA